MAGSNELAAQLAKFAEQMGMQLTPKGGGSWAGNAPAADAPFVGVSIPIKVQTPMGSVRCYLALPAEAASSGVALQEAIKRLSDMGLTVDAFASNNGGGGGNYGPPRQQFNGGQNNGNSFRRW